ncbi:hypothetical protein VK70_09440 [Paenibacillus durus ATCC 35681]|uniref:UDP-glucuronosyltransferase n=1 Tax=Paenibacillus durus ATCC 35681 TaxID=1333534 RepID=A0A0F7CHU0_PAEDU|nr:hypothetical protein VK70_09440 [Paenibacillus durus ATCC 35681]
MASGRRPITLLGSGNSLGVYVPIMQLGRQLSGRGIPAEVYVLEDLYLDHIKQKVPVYKKAFHQSFAVAKKGAELARDISSCLDSVKLRQLFEVWSREGRTRLITATGFWLPIIEQYQRYIGSTRLEVDCLHLDAVHSPSYLVYENIGVSYNHIWFYDPIGKSMSYRIAISDEAPIPLRMREERYIAHGGGWGIGTYPSAVQELLEAGKRLNVLAYYEEDIKPHEQIQYYMNDPEWSPWIKDEYGRMQFPPLARIELGQAPVYRNEQPYPPLFEVIRNSAAIISKPGGYSLMESLAAATPFVFLEPFGRHEAANAAYWIKQGFGIWYEDWKAQRYSMDTLISMHENLIRARNQSMDYGGILDAAQNNAEIR